MALQGLRRTDGGGGGGEGGGGGCQMCHLEGLQLEGHLDALTSIIARRCYCWPALPYKNNPKHSRPIQKVLTTTSSLPFSMQRMAYMARLAKF